VTRDPGFSCSHDDDLNPCPSQISHDVRVQSLEQQRIETEVRLQQQRAKFAKIRESLQLRCLKCDAPTIRQILTSGGVESCLCVLCWTPDWSGGDVDRFLSHRWGEPLRYEGYKVYECSACGSWRRLVMTREECLWLAPEADRRLDVWRLWDGSSGCIAQEPVAAEPECPLELHKPQAVMVSSFVEGHGFTRVEVHFRVGVDILMDVKVDRDKRDALERAVERAIRGIVIELKKEEA
jgi:hypothetical protein